MLFVRRGFWSDHKSETLLEVARQNVVLKFSFRPKPKDKIFL